MAKRTWIRDTDLECSGAGRARKPRKRYKQFLNVCFKVRKLPSDWYEQKDSIAEVFSGKTGKSLGFIGPECTLVPKAEDAQRANYMNRFNTEGRLLGCMESDAPWKKEPSKRFRKAIKDAEKKTADVTPRARRDSAAASRRRKRAGK